MLTGRTGFRGLGQAANQVNPGVAPAGMIQATCGGQPCWVDPSNLPSYMSLVQTGVTTAPNTVVAYSAPPGTPVGPMVTSTNPANLTTTITAPEYVGQVPAILSGPPVSSAIPYTPAQLTGTSLIATNQPPTSQPVVVNPSPASQPTTTGTAATSPLSAVSVANGATLTTGSTQASTTDGSIIPGVSNTVLFVGAGVLGLIAFMMMGQR